MRSSTILTPRQTRAPLSVTTERETRRWGHLLQSETRFFSCSLGIAQKILVAYVKDKRCEQLSYLMFPFCLFFPFYYNLYPALRYLHSGNGYFWSQMRVLPGGDLFRMIFQFHLFLLGYLHMTFFSIRVVMVHLLTSLNADAWRTTFI